MNNEQNEGNYEQTFKTRSPPRVLINDWSVPEFKGADFSKVQSSGWAHSDSLMSGCSLLVTPGQLPRIWAECQAGAGATGGSDTRHSQPVLSCLHCCTGPEQIKGTSNYDVIMRKLHTNDDYSMFSLSCHFFETFNFTLNCTKSTSKLYLNRPCLWSTNTINMVKHRIITKIQDQDQN